MAAIRDRMVADRDLPERKRRDLAWALAAVPRAFGLAADVMPADPGLISDKLEGFAPATAGLTVGTWKNALTLTRFALRRADIIKTPARRIERFDTTWTALMKLPTRKHDQIGLSRLARFCTEHGIDPEQVDDRVFDDFLADLETNQVVKYGRKVHRRAAQIWNPMATTTRNWPTQSVTVPSYSRVYALGWEAFPASLIADIEAHLHFLSGADILADLEMRPLKPSSLRTRRHQLGAYISSLVLGGADPSRFHTLADVVTVDLVRKGLHFFIARAEAGSTAQAYGIARTLLSIARHWVKLPAEELMKLQLFCKRLDQANAGLSVKNRTRLRQFDDPANVQKLLELPSRLVAKARRREGKPTAADALLVQTAFAIELLLMMPVRRQNLAGLNVAQHIVRDRTGAVYLLIPGSEVKNGVAVEAKLLPETIKLLDLYRNTYRPLLTATPSDWMFPGPAGRPKSRERMAFQVSETVKREAGLIVNMHLFRHIAAKLYLDRNPGGYGIVQRLHGHKSIQTTIRSYCGMEVRSAVEHYDNTILNLRRPRAGSRDPSGTNR